MIPDPAAPPPAIAASQAAEGRPASARRPRGYWGEVWRRYRRDRLGVLGLILIGLLGTVGLGAPFIAGTRPIACRYQGEWRFPVLAHYSGSRRENAVFIRLEGGGILERHYPEALAEDPRSIAIWPLFYADPHRRIEDGEWRGRAGDPYDEPPSARNPFGTDREGRDVLARMVHGTSTALLVGFVSMGIAAAIGILLGGIAGYFRGWGDTLLSRLVDLMMSIPSIILVLALVAVLESPTIWHVMAVIGLTGWHGIARYVRGEFLRLRETEFVLAARALGASHLRIILRHLLPNALAPVLVVLTFGIAGAILLESSISFIGIGLDTSTPSWGRILQEGFGSRLEKWWLVLFPGLAIFIAVLAYNLTGEAFQEAADPRLRR